MMGRKQRKAELENLPGLGVIDAINFLAQKVEVQQQVRKTRVPFIQTHKPEQHKQDCVSFFLEDHHALGWTGAYNFHYPYCINQSVIDIVSPRGSLVKGCLSCPFYEQFDV